MASTFLYINKTKLSEKPLTWFRCIIAIKSKCYIIGKTISPNISPIVKCLGLYNFGADVHKGFCKIEKPEPTHIFTC